MEKKEEGVDGEEKREIIVGITAKNPQSECDVLFP